MARKILFGLKMSAEDDVTPVARRVEGSLDEVRRTADRVGDEIDDIGDDAKAAARKVETAGEKMEGALDEVQREAANTKTGMGGIGKTFAGLGASAAVASVLAMGNAFADSALETEKFSQQLNISVGEASGLEDALNSVGGRATTLRQVAQEITTIGVEAAGGSKIAAAGIEALGVGVDEFVALSANEQVRLLIDSIGAAGEGSEELGDIMQAFGRGPVAELRGAMGALGTDGYDALVQKGKDLGHTMTEEGVEAAREYKLAMGAINSEFQQMISDNLPTITAGINIFGKGLDFLSNEVVANFVPAFKNAGQSIANLFGADVTTEAQRYNAAIREINEDYALYIARGGEAFEWNVRNWRELEQVRNTLNDKAKAMTDARLEELRAIRATQDYTVALDENSWALIRRAEAARLAQRKNLLSDERGGGLDSRSFQKYQSGVEKQFAEIARTASSSFSRGIRESEPAPFKLDLDLGAINKDLSIDANLDIQAGLLNALEPVTDNTSIANLELRELVENNIAQLEQMKGTGDGIIRLTDLLDQKDSQILAALEFQLGLAREAAHADGELTGLEQEKINIAQRQLELAYKHFELDYEKDMKAKAGAAAGGGGTGGTPEGFKVIASGNDPRYGTYVRYTRNVAQPPGVKIEIDGRDIRSTVTRVDDSFAGDAGLYG